MTKEEEIMKFLHKNVFDPILDSKEATPEIRAGVNLTISRMERLPAKSMRQYYWDALVQDNAKRFSQLLKQAGLPRFEDVVDEFKTNFSDEWLNS